MRPGEFVEVVPGLDCNFSGLQASDTMQGGKGRRELFVSAMLEKYKIVGWVPPHRKKYVHKRK